MTLHITNGDTAVAVMRKAGIEGEILPWRDVLHEGPVPAGLPLEELSKVRALFIADCGWLDAGAAQSDFNARDAQLASFRDHDEVVLWFEHDLYDQLQLLQLLDYFAAQDRGRTQPEMICVDEYLGTVTPARMAALQDEMRPVSPSQLGLAQRAWAAFRAPDPAAWLALMDEDTSALPFLAGAVVRHLEQYPSTFNGLNRTESQLLEAVRSGVRAPGRIFEASQRAEERVFMGDSTFWRYMDAMFRSRPALLETVAGKPFSLAGAASHEPAFRQQEISITDAGRQVLDGMLDWVDVNGIDKWLGGVHLTPDRAYRWDAQARRVSAGPRGKPLA